MPREKQSAKKTRTPGAGKKNIKAYAHVASAARRAANAARGGVVSATLLRMLNIARLYDALGKMPTSTQIMRTLGGDITASGVRSSIVKLTKAGYLKQVGYGAYEIAKRPDPALLSRRDRDRWAALQAREVAAAGSDAESAADAPLRRGYTDALLVQAAEALAPFAAYAAAHPDADDKTTPILMARDHIRVAEMRAAAVARALLLDAVAAPPAPTRKPTETADDPDLVSFL